MSRSDEFLDVDRDGRGSGKKESEGGAQASVSAGVREKHIQRDGSRDRCRGCCSQSAWLKGAFDINAIAAAAKGDRGRIGGRQGSAINGHHPFCVVPDP